MAGLYHAAPVQRDDGPWSIPGYRALCMKALLYAVAGVDGLVREQLLQN